MKNSSHAPGFDTWRYGSPAEEMAAHDALPRAVRDAMNYSLVNWSSQGAHHRHYVDGESSGEILEAIYRAERRWLEAVGAPA